MTPTKLYRVREGVAWVNGARVPADRTVRLSDAEARFDLEQGRIAPAAPPQPSGKSSRRAAIDLPAKEDVIDHGRG